jgi:hypothetical protein
MTNINEKQFENLENLTDEQLEALELQNDNDENGSVETPVDYKAQYEAEKEAREKAERRAATVQRLLNKKPKTETLNNRNGNITNLEKDIADIKFSNKIDNFARENSMNRSQAEYIFKLYPNATEEILKDPFVKAGLKAIASEKRLSDNTPRGRSASQSTSNKSYKEMNQSEKEEWYKSHMSNTRD